MVHTYGTSDFSNFGEILEAFTGDVSTPFDIDAAVASVAGPVVGRRGGQPGAVRNRHVRRIRRGGIAPQILPALQDGRFIEAFRDKGLMSELVANIPVYVMLTPEAALFGAAVFAQELAG